MILVSAVNAQNARNGLDMLNSRINAAQELLKLFPDSQAEQWIDSAIRQRDEAVSFFNRGRNNLAAAKIKAALVLINQAIDRISAVPVDRIQEQIDELIRNAEQLVPGMNNREAERMLSQAKENRQAGIRALRNKQTRKAMEHFRVAKFYAERSIGLVRTSGLTVNPETLEEEKEKYLELVNRAEELVGSCNDEQAIKLINQAKEQYHNILQAVQSGNYKVAIGLYYSNTRLLLRAIDLCQGQGFSIREQAVEEVEMLGELLNTAKNETHVKSGSQAGFVLDRVERIYDQANTALNGERYEIAIRRAVLGRNVLNRLWSNTPTQMNERVEQELERLRDEIDRQEDNSAAGTRNELLKAAQSSADDAQRYLGEGRTRLALEMIYAGNRFVNAASSPAADANQDDVRARADQLEQEIHKYESRENTETNVDFVTEAKKMLQRAEQALASNQAIAANEYIKLGFNFLDKIH